ncbi:MAG: Uma2 family endonuclease [Marinilabiliaceae bacterium]|nr:Uma2 family endonuclease [Marinilabiliaceae bacterium]
MTTHLDLTKQYTYVDYLSEKFNDVKCEIINGFINLMAGPSRNHSGVSSNIVTYLNHYALLHDCKCFVRHAPFDVVLGDNKENVIQPDVFIVCDESKMQEKACFGAPDLVVEVISPSNTKKLMRYKYQLYEKHKVLEYWVVYPKDQEILVFCHQGEEYDNGTVYTINDFLQPKCLPVKVNVKDLFKNI